MKKFHFSLERMRNYKEQLLETQKNTLRALRSEKQELDQRAADYRAALVNAGNELKRRTAEGISMIEMRSYSFRMENLRIQIEELKKEQQRMDRRVERQTQVVLAAQQEVSGLDKLEEKQLEEYQREQMHADEQFVAEYLSTKLAMEKASPPAS